MAAWPERVVERRSVLIVEDFAPFRRVLARLLAGDGWRVLEAASGRQALRLARKHRPRLAVVDWVLDRGMDGLAVMRSLRRLRPGPMPVIVVSAVRDSVEDEAVALAAGAALFFGKLEVAAAGIAFLRHVNALCATPHDVISLGGGFLLDLSSGTLRGPGHEVALNPQECRLLEALARARGRLVAHETLWDEVWGAPADGWRHVLNNRLSTLRRKAGPLAARLLCRRGEGFLLQPRG